MGERRSHGNKTGNRLPSKSHGASLRSGIPVARRAAPWELSQAQSAADKGALVKRVHFENIAKKYPVFGNREMPAYAKKQELIYTVENNKASGVKGATGSGKSTQLGQFLYEAGHRIYHIVPRRLIADGLADRLVDEMSEHADNADEIVGVTHGDRTNVHPNNKITVMTAQTFLLMEKDIREQYGDEKVTIICDETHESNLYVDVAMGVAAQSVSQQPNWHVVAVSATQNEEAVSRAFSGLTKGKVPTVEIEGRPHEMETHERPDQETYEVYADVGHNHKVSMIFTRGHAQIEHIIDKTKKELDSRESGTSDNVEFRELHRDLTRTERYHVLRDPAPEGKRVVIVSTPIGMSGHTVAGLTLVITDGTINRKELDDEAVGGLIARDLPQDGILQQFGRAGRDVEGGVGYLTRPTVIHEAPLSKSEIGSDGQEKVPEATIFVPFRERKRFGKPEIYDSLLGQVALTVAALDMSFYDVNKFLPNPLEGTRIIEAQEGLYRMGAMMPTSGDGNDLFTISDIGRKMNTFPIRPELSRGMVEAQGPGRSLKHMARVACIAAALDAGGLQNFSKDAGTAWEQLLRHSTKDDWIAQLDIMQALPNLGEKVVDEKFVVDYDLNYQQVDRAMHVVRKIMKELDIANPESVRDIRSNQQEEQAAIADLMAGMGDNVYRKNGTKYRRTMYSNIHGGQDATQRFVSDRSVTPQAEYQHVAAWPRYFIQSKTGNKKDIIELTTPANVEDVARYARTHDTFERQASGGIRIDGGSAKQEYIPMFGSIQIGAPELGVPESVVPPEVREVVVDYVLNHPGNVQTELRRVASVLEWFQKAVPAETLNAYKADDAPEMLTNDAITLKIVDLARTMTEFHKIDQALGAFLRHGSYHVSRYFDEPAYEELTALAPEELELANGNFAKVLYESPSTPYITMPTMKDARNVLRSSNMTLPDGRDIFVKTHDSTEQAVYLRADQI